MMKNLNKAVLEIKKAKTIIIFAHVNPDGDTIGSLLSLGLGLKSMGKNVVMLSADGVPRRYLSLPGAKEVKRKYSGRGDIAVSVDCSSPKIIGKVYKNFLEAKNSIVIDHHEIRETYGNIEIIDHAASSVGEMVYKLLKKLKVAITEPIARNILTSLIVETNSFNLPSVSSYSLKLSAELIKTGVEFDKLIDQVYWSKTKQAVILSGLCLSKCKFLENDKIVWSLIKLRDFEKFEGKDEDIDAVPSEMRMIKGVKVVVLFREKSDKELRVSLRSKDKLNVALLAENFGGGGHYDIAGCEIENSSKAIKQFLRSTEKFLKTGGKHV